MLRLRKLACCNRSVDLFTAGEKYQARLNIFHSECTISSAPSDIQYPRERKNSATTKFIGIPFPKVLFFIVTDDRNQASVAAASVYLS